LTVSTFPDGRKKNDQPMTGSADGVSPPAEPVALSPIGEG
jgi:hypothetical protein